MKLSQWTLAADGQYEHCASDAYRVLFWCWSYVLIYSVPPLGAVKIWTTSFAHAFMSHRDERGPAWTLHLQLLMVRRTLKPNTQLTIVKREGKIVSKCDSVTEIANDCLSLSIRRNLAMVSINASTYENNSLQAADSWKFSEIPHQFCISCQKRQSFAIKTLLIGVDSRPGNPRMSGELCTAFFSIFIFTIVPLCPTWIWIWVEVATKPQGWSCQL